MAQRITIAGTRAGMAWRQRAPAHSKEAGPAAACGTSGCGCGYGYRSGATAERSARARAGGKAILRVSECLYEGVDHGSEVRIAAACEAAHQEPEKKERAWMR